MAKYELKYLKKAHEHSIYNEEEILKSNICGCFYCISTFSPAEIEEICDTNSPKGSTAICPKCGIDSVLGSKSGYPVDDQAFLEEMRNYWFGESSKLFKPGDQIEQIILPDIS
jgi:hypothetical protein